jgi:hypothetical protein
MALIIDARAAKFGMQLFCPDNDWPLTKWQ